MEEIFEIRSCIEILPNDIKVDTADHCRPEEFTIIQRSCLINYINSQELETSFKYRKFHDT